MKKINIKLWLSIGIVCVSLSETFAQTNNQKNMGFKDNMTALELYDTTKSAGDAMRSSGKKGSVNISERPRVNVSGYAVKVGPDVYGLPSVEVSENKGGKTRALCVLPFTDYLKLRHVSKGDKVVISGNVLGFAPEYDIVVVKQSKIVSVNDKQP